MDRQELIRDIQHYIDGTHGYATCFHIKEAQALIERIKASNKADLQFFIKAGQDGRQRVQNIAAHYRAMQLGIDVFRVNEHGWYHYDDLLKQVELIEFRHSSEKNYCWNYIEIYQAPNGKYLYGNHFDYATGGGSHGVSIWGKSFKTIEKCKEEALNHLIDNLSNKTDKKAIDVLKQVKKYKINTVEQPQLF